MQTRGKRKLSLSCTPGCWISSSKPVLPAAWSFITCFVGRREPFSYCRKTGLSNSFGGPQGEKLTVALSSNVVQNHMDVGCTGEDTGLCSSKSQEVSGIKKLPRYF